MRLEPEKRKVGLDARVTVDGVAYEVEPDLAGEKVILWWGLFDSELYVEHQETRYGPYAPIGKPIPIHSYRSFKKTNTQKRADRIEKIAQQLALPSSAIGKVELPVVAENVIPFPVRSFVDPDPFEELTFKNAIEAKRAIAYYPSSAPICVTTDLSENDNQSQGNNSTNVRVGVILIFDKIEIKFSMYARELKRLLFQAVELLFESSQNLGRERFRGKRDYCVS